MTSMQDETRLAALDRYDVVDTPPEEAFDRITRLTRRLLGVPMSTITFIDGHRQWFKSRQGLDACETARGPAFCRLVVEGGDALVVADATSDPRFVQNEFVLGAPHVRAYAGVPLRVPDGTTIGTLCAIDTVPRTFEASDLDALSDLAALVADALELRLLVTTDALTGAASRRAFRVEAERAVKLSRRHRHPLSCIAFDLDHFKLINDRHGHATGDEVLVSVIQACRAVLRETDVVGRLGGEEFAVLLPHTGADKAALVAEKLRAAIAAPHGDLPPITASFGVAALEAATGDSDDLLRQADGALYAAKAAGRNRCMTAAPEAPSAGAARRVFKAGRISFNAGRSSVDCTVRSLSEVGAALDVVTTAGIPDLFKLEIGQDHTSRLCRIAAKRDRHIDVAFA